MITYVYTFTKYTYRFRYTMKHIETIDSDISCNPMLTSRHVAEQKINQAPANLDREPALRPGKVSRVTVLWRSKFVECWGDNL